MNHNVHEVEKKKRKFNRSFIKHLISSPHPLSLFLCPGNSDVDNDVVGCRLIRAMANRGKCHVVTRNNLQRGSNVLSLFFFFFSNISSTYFFSRRDETRLLTRGWHFFPRAAYLLRVCKPSHHFSSNELETKKYFSSFFFFFFTLTVRKLFTYAPLLSILRWNGRTDSRRGNLLRCPIYSHRYLFYWCLLFIRESC